MVKSSFSLRSLRASLTNKPQIHTAEMRRTQEWRGEFKDTTKKVGVGLLENTEGVTHP